jgi:FAD/FMN-containing dehydrogenase
VKKLSYVHALQELSEPETGGACMPLWRNWSGSVIVNPRNVEAVLTEAEIVDLVRRADSGRQGIRVVGSGHSFTPLCATQDILVSLDGLQGFSSIDPSEGQATVLAGTKISQLGVPLLEAGVALENQGDVDYQSVAGAISTGTHGTGSRFGSLSTQVTALRLTLASGEIITCSETEEPATFKAAQLSLGLLGIVSQVRLRVVPAYRLLERTWVEGVERCLAEFDSLDQSNRHVEFFWVPATDTCALKTLNSTDDEPRGIAPGDLAPPGTIERYVLPERVDWSHRIFPSERRVLFNEMEFAVPYASGRECFAEIRELMLGKHRDVRWSVEYRTQKADEVYLSPAYQRKVVTISVHQAAELPYQSFFNDVETIFRNHQGRPHWGKLHSHAAKELRALYPKWDSFQAIRERLDPDQRFLNSYLHGLMLH